jgi:hypothetical protein
MLFDVYELINPEPNQSFRDYSNYDAPEARSPKFFKLFYLFCLLK